MKIQRQIIKNALLFCLTVLLSYSTTYAQYNAQQIAGGASMDRLPGIGNPAHVDDAFNIGIPGPVAVAPNGDMAWADYWDGNLMHWNSATNVIEMLIARGSAMEGIGGPIENATNGDRISGITFDSDNNIWYSNSNRILKVDMNDRTLHHIAGSGAAGTPDFSLPMEEANLHAFGIAFNHDESILFVNLLGPSMVAALHLATGEVEHIAGTGSQTDGIPAGLALLSNLRQPFGLDYVKDPEGVEWLYIASQQKMVYSVNLNTGILYPFAGTGAWNQSGDGGLATAATLLQPHDIVVDATNSYVYFGDHQGNHHGVRRVDVKTGIIERYTGIQSSPDLDLWLEDAYADPTKRVGHRLEIPTNRAVGVDLDNDGNLIVGTRSPLLFKVDVETDQMELIAGYEPTPPPLDGPGTPGIQATDMDIQAWGVVVKDGKPHFFDVNSRKIVTLEDDGTTTVLAGNGNTDFLFTDGVTSVSLDDMQFNAIRYMILDDDGNIIASDFGHHTVYKIDLTAEVVTVVAGSGSNGYDAAHDGAAANAAKLNQPHGIRFNNDFSELYIADFNNKRIRVVEMATGIINTFAGTGSNGETNDPTALLEANIQAPRDIVVDDSGLVYVATSQHKKIYILDEVADEVTVLTPKAFRQPFAMQLAGNTIWVNDELSIKTVDLATGDVYTVNDNIAAGWALAADGTDLYVTARANGLFHLNIESPATLALIQGYADASDATDLTLAMLDELGAPTIEFNLEAYKTAVEEETSAELPSVQSVQKLVMDVNAEQAAAVLATIDGFAVANDASALELFHLAIVGMNNVVDANLTFYRASVEAADSIADQAALQALINEGNANGYLVLINAMAVADDATDLTFTLIRNAGADPANIRQNTFYNYLPHYQEGVAAATGVATQAELDTILIAANTAGEAALVDDALAAINDMAVASDASDLTFALIVNAGANAEMLNLDFLAYYITGVEEATGVADAAALDAIIAAANTAGAAAEAANALAMINQMAIDSDASDLTRNMLLAAGATNLMGDVPHFEAYQAGIEAATGVADLAALQTIIDAANLELAILKIVAFAEADDASSMSAQDLVDAGVDPAVIIPTNIDAYQTAVADAAGTDVDTTAKIEALVVASNESVTLNAVAAIIDMSVAGDAADLTALLLTQAGMDFDEQYLDAYILAVSASGALADADAIQELLTFVTTCETVKGMAGSELALDLTVEMLDILGIENVFAVIFEENYYQDALFLTTELTDCDAAIQAIIDATNFAYIQEMAEFDYADELTIEMLEAVGVTDVNPDLLADYQTAVADATSIDDLAALQAIINEVNTVSVNDLTNNELLVYPNPAKEVLHIASDVTINEIRIISTLGQVVHFDYVGALQTQIPVSGFDNGIYLIQIVTQDGTQLRKVEVNK